MLLVMLGCRTTWIGSGDSIAVPAGLEGEQVELAIMKALASRPRSNDGPDIVVDIGQFSARIDTDAFDQDPAQEGWHAESIEGDVVYAGFYRGAHYLRVAIGHDPREVRVRIVSSRNLKQSGHRIHKNAKIWVAQLEDRIRRQLSTAAFARPKP
jgi:hypothetical protein